MSKKKKKAKKHQVRAVNPGSPPDVTSNPQNGYTPKEPTTKALKSRLLR